jgi:hypothetical protein
VRAGRKTSRLSWTPEPGPADENMPAFPAPQRWFDGAGGMSRPGSTAGRKPDRRQPAPGGSCRSDECPRALPIDGVLDLHTFPPRQIKQLIPDYLEQCRRCGLLKVRIIHGKGTGTLRRTVHAVLARIPEVAGFRLADEAGGGWGATTVELGPWSDTDNAGTGADPPSGDAGRGRIAMPVSDSEP